MRKMLWRVILISALLIAGSTVAYAQDDAEETPALVIDGSARMESLISELVSAYQTDTESEIDVTINTNGTNAALEAFCNGELFLAMTTRFLNFDEAALCEANNITFIEYLLGYDVLVVLASDSLADSATCLTIDQLDGVYGLVAEGSETQAQNFGIADDESPVTVYSPASGTLAADLLAEVIHSGELRSDLTTYDDPAELVELLSSEEGAIAYLTLAEFEALEDTEALNRVDIQNPENGTCASSNLSQVEVREYAAARPYAMYVNALALQADVTMGQFLTYAATSANGITAVLGEANASPAGDVSLGRNVNNLLQPVTGRTFSREAAPVSIANTAEGTVTVAGDPLTQPIANAVSGSFRTEYVAATLETDLVGNDNGFAALCAGEADAIFSTRQPTDDESALCAENDIELFEVEVATNALVFAVSSQNEDLPTCLTTDELVSIFAAPDQGNTTDIELEDDREIPRGILNWNEINGDYPDAEITLFIPDRSSYELDWLFTATGAAGTFARSSREENVTYDRSFGDAALYRAASIANYDGAAIGVLQWGDYDRSERKNGLRLLEVDAGSGCVAPDEATIADGSYPLTTTTTLYLSRKAAGDEVVGAYLWTLFGEEALSSLEDSNLVSVNTAELRQARDQVFVLIREAIAAAAAQAAEEAESTEGDAEATAEPTVEPTEEMTPEPTEEPTVEPTEEMTPEPTEEPTVEPTEEMTPEPTEEPTEEPTSSN